MERVPMRERHCNDMAAAYVIRPDNLTTCCGSDEGSLVMLQPLSS